MSEDRWKSLEVWQIADALAFSVYQATKNFPREEIFGLTSQLRRAALSIPTNLVEGYSRRGDKELHYFVNVSLGSLAEAKYLLHFAYRLGYLEEKSHSSLEKDCKLLGKKLWRFYEKLKQP